MVNVLTAALDGSISLNSELGEGTEIRVSFNAPKPKVVPKVNKPQIPSKIPQKSLTLVVDDYSDACVMFKAILEMLGNKVIICNTGEEAIKQYEKHSPNLVILDYSLPDITGADVAKRIRKIEQHQESASLIVGCSSAGKSIQTEFFESGINEYIEKPFEIHDLVNLTSSAKKANDTSKLIKNITDKDTHT
jgi:CheY-like chemotaxis protein